MRKIVAWIVIQLVLGAAPLFGGEASLSDWHQEYAPAWEEAHRSGHSVLLFLTMDGCGYCAKMARHTFADADVQSAIEEGFVPACVDGLRQRELASRLRVTSYPVTVIVGHDHRVIERLEGYVKPHELQQTLRSIQTRVSQAPPQKESPAQSR